MGGDIVQIVEVADFKEKLGSAGDKLVVIDFWASWCGPCMAFAPQFEELSKTFTNAIFYKVNVDDASELSESEEITAMPTFKLYKNGACVDTVVGASKPKLKTSIEQHI